MESEPTYTVFIRLPFPRGDFVDPPPVNWDSAKDEALWNILSGVSKGEIDWDAIAVEFDVTVDFLLQQVTYLTERHAAQVRAQMRKLTAAKGSAAPSPVPPSDLAAVTASDMRRTGSGAGAALGQARAPSSLSIRRDVQTPRSDPVSVAGSTTTAGKAPFAKQPATRTSPGGTGPGSMGPAPQRKTGANTPRQPLDPPRKRLSSLGMPTTPTAATMRTARQFRDDEDTESPGPADSSSESSSESSSPAQSRIIRRPPRFSAPSGGGKTGDGQESPEDEDVEPAFLPQEARSEQYSDPGATLRGEPHSSRRPVRSQSTKDRIGSITQSNTSDSSTGSAALINKSPVRDERFYRTPVSPRRTAELSGRAGSNSKGKGYSRDGSDGGTPSMGSSFSDLDDASVTQSALEEALASNMQDGTIGSRMSTIGQAFRSRYLPHTTRSTEKK
ncbi:hypothetical protein MGG_02790 [Pyricularia oryzae 70-15]|uniref:Autophagy-related protein 29 n=1 Tax=Pyricularia oryzae (strain 70-15 / ATCC MYA-4617 / FGSC 8958) TaxID=242507 RepID=G4NIZ2_PYRO7|nr:uncharacterized protein MGG_02790 [Pyricularia oryzae 70-15]EHA46208.1 hypothetical protein MGG_02790 [Pyricularia oryzae 70-15]KAI7920514.1 hypothetical protein M9X92_005821 [Pyricularia oryzae]KAI7925288.1 hypothetical protein M0657_004264 [Pyricularia oryzae]